MNKQELIKEVKEIGIYGLNIFGTVVEGIPTKTTIKLIKQLDEPEKVTIPQSVVDWIEHFKKCSGTLYGSTAPYLYYGRAITDDFEGDVTKVLRWIRDNSEVYARAWLDGYEVEEEKRYLVKVKGVNEYGCYLNKGSLSKEYFLESKAKIGGCRTKHTRKELEEDGFGWVFNCPGIEIEEVTE